MVIFDAFSHKWLQISLDWFSKNRLHVFKEFCQSVKVCHLLVKDGGSGHLASMLLISLDQLFPKNSANLSKCSISNVTLVKAKSATITLFSSPPFLLLALPFLLSFSFVTLILELLGLKKRAFWRFFTQMTANFVGLVVKKSARYLIISLNLFA